jgi:uncharacterized protein
MWQNNTEEGDYMIYNYNQVTSKSNLKKKLIIGFSILILFIAVLTAINIYIEIVQLDEIGGYSSICIKNITYKGLYFIISFLIIFISVFVTTNFIIKNIYKYSRIHGLSFKRLPKLSLCIIISLLGSIASKDYFYLKALKFLNSETFGINDPIFGKDIGYYIFERPFLVSIYEFFSALWIFIIIYTLVYYLFAFFTTLTNFTVKEMKIKSILTHNLINIAIYFIIKTFSYRFLKEDRLYSKVVESTGAGYTDVNVWMLFYSVAPILLIIITLISFFFIVYKKIKPAVISILIFPVSWILVSIISGIIQSFVVSPNEFNLESKYLKHNIMMTRHAYNLDVIKNYDFKEIVELTPEIINRNLDTKDNIRIVDYESTLVSNIQLQSNTNFYTFNDGDIINYDINGRETPVFITAREIDKNRLPDKTYLNTTYKYTHGYGIVMNPINKLTSNGQNEFIISGLVMRTIDENLKLNRPEIYYGELTKDYVIVRASNNLNEIDYDGNIETRYEGTGGINLSFLNRVLFALKYSDLKLITSGYAKNATLLPNRHVVDRAQKAVPFLTVDNDPYVLLTEEGRIKWVLDAYTKSEFYPYSQRYGNINYIRNSVKIVIDAYDGKTEYYVIDKNDPVIRTYSKIYPGVFLDRELPEFLNRHMKYPEMLFKIQTEMLKTYHLKPEEVNEFYGKQDLWDIAKYPANNASGVVKDIDPYYNMIKLPGDFGENAELVLMRPFTPSGELKHNMVSWLAVRNSKGNYGEMILFHFPKNTNIFGPNQVEVKINQINEVSKDMTLWGQSGSDVYKGSLLVIPIENSVLYIEPVYIRAAGTSSIPEVREIIVGYQSGDELKYGVGVNLDSSLDDLFADITGVPVTPVEDDGQEEIQEDRENGEGEEIEEEEEQRELEETENQEIITDILDKYDEMKRQLEDLGELINKLK